MIADTPDASHVGLQLLWLVVLPLPIASVAWTVTHEEIFREIREHCVSASKTARNVLARKFFYVFTCEYCFSHYISALAVVGTGFHLLRPDWTGMVIGGFALVWLANIQMSLFALLRLDLKARRNGGNIVKVLVGRSRPRLLEPGLKPVDPAFESFWVRPGAATAVSVPGAVDRAAEYGMDTPSGQPPPYYEPGPHTGLTTVPPTG